MIKRCRVMAALLLVLYFQTTVLAAVPQIEETFDKVYFEDGSYLQITTIVENFQMRSSSRNASKKFDYYTSDDRIAVSYMLTGSFEYDGRTSSATDVTASVSIYQSGWSLKSHHEDCSGSSVYGTATFSGPSGDKTLSGSITCDKNGNIT